MAVIVKTSTPGPDGPPGTGINPRGAWSSTTQYEVNDCVQYNGSAYTALATSIGAEPDITPLQWSLFVESGVSEAQLPSLVVQQSATFAELPTDPLGLFLVLADETKGGNPTIYLFTSAHRYWVAMVQDA
jgi:hypothetical protein